MDDSDDTRVNIPLMLLKGNMDALLENEIECNSITLKWYGGNAVVLTLNMSPEQKEAALKLGFRTKKITNEGE